MNSEKLPFATGDLVVYPTHGVGKILGIETQEIAGHTLSVFVVHFDKDRMTLRVPLGKTKAAGLRKLSVTNATLRCTATIKCIRNQNHRPGQPRAVFILEST